MTFTLCWIVKQNIADTDPVNRKHCSVASQVLYLSQMEQRSLAPGQELFWKQHFWCQEEPCQALSHSACFTVSYSVKPRLWNLVIFSLLILMTLLSCSRTYLKHIIKMWKYHCSFCNRFRIPKREGWGKASFPRDHPVLKTSWLKCKYMSVSKNRGNHWYLHSEESYNYWRITTTLLVLEFT